MDRLSVGMRIRAAAFLMALILIILPCVGAYAEAGDEANGEALSTDDIKGGAAILIDYETGRVLFEKNADKKMHPASTTKVMTALLALENGNLEDEVTVPKAITKLPKDSSKVPLKAGEKLKLIDLLYGMMLPSGNDAAVAIAVHISGSVDSFVEKMNDRAKELGCENTHFANPHGYMNSKHYSTARDLALITREAMKNETFRQIVSAKTYTIPKTNKSKKRKIKTRTEMIAESSKYYYEYEIGVKTGQHSKAGYCFIGAAEKDGLTLISVTLKSTSKGQWNDTRKMSEYGFSRFKSYSFDEIYQTAPITVEVENSGDSDSGAETLELAIEPGGSANDYSISCLTDEFSENAGEVMKRVSAEYTKALVAPIKAGEVVGSLLLQTEDGRRLTSVLTASRDVATADGQVVAAATTGTQGSASGLGFWWVLLLLVAVGALAYGAYWFLNSKGKIGTLPIGQKMRELLLQFRPRNRSGQNRKKA